MNVEQMRKSARQKCEADGINSSWTAYARRHELDGFLEGSWNPPSNDGKPTSPNSSGNSSSSDNNGTTGEKSLSDMEKVIGDYSSEKVLEKMEDKYGKKIEEMIEERVEEVTRPIQITVKDQVVFDQVDGDLIHFQYQDCLDKLITHGKLFMVGERGTGKSTIAEQLFKVISKHKEWDEDDKFKYTYAVGTAGVSEAQLLGKSTFDGRYIEGQYVKPFSEGGFIVADEFNGFDPNMSLIHNSMLDGQGLMFTPNDPENPYRFRHDDFSFIAIDNSTGYGNSHQYVGRNQQDMATLDRFTGAVISIDYDNEIEKAIVGEYKELADALFELRLRIRDQKLRYNISTRAFSTSAKTIHSAVNGVIAEKSVTPMTLGKGKKIEGGLSKASIFYALADLTAQWTDEEKSKINLEDMMEKFPTNYKRAEPRVSSLDDVTIKKTITL